MATCHRTGALTREEPLPSKQPPALPRGPHDLLISLCLVPVRLAQLSRERGPWPPQAPGSKAQSTAALRGSDRPGSSVFPGKFRGARGQWSPQEATATLPGPTKEGIGDGPAFRGLLVGPWTPQAGIRNVESFRIEALRQEAGQEGGHWDPSGWPSSGENPGT